MKPLINVIILSLLSQVCFAGVGGGGTGPRPSIVFAGDPAGVTLAGGNSASEGSRPTLVFHAGQSGAETATLIAELVDGKWKTTKVAIPNEAISPELAAALEESRTTGNWANFSN